jgi:hypothetical protein
MVGKTSLLESARNVASDPFEKYCLMQLSTPQHRRVSERHADRALLFNVQTSRLRASFSWVQKSGKCSLLFPASDSADLTVLAMSGTA